MFMSEEELAIEVGEIYGVQIYDVNLTEARKRKVLKQFAPDAASADHQYTRL
jgi:hypothetical protein